MPEKGPGGRIESTKRPFRFIIDLKHVDAFVKALEAEEFEKVEPDIQTSKIWDKHYLWFVDEFNDTVIIERAHKKNKRIVTCDRGCIPVISDIFGGLDILNKVAD